MRPDALPSPLWGCLLYTNPRFNHVSKTLILTEGFKLRLKIASDSAVWPGQPAGMRAEAKRGMDKIVRNDFE